MMSEETVRQLIPLLGVLLGLISANFLERFKGKQAREHSKKQQKIDLYTSYLQLLIEYRAKLYTLARIVRGDEGHAERETTIGGAYAITLAVNNNSVREKGTALNDPIDPKKFEEMGQEARITYYKEKLAAIDGIIEVFAKERDKIIEQL